MYNGFRGIEISIESVLGSGCRKAVTALRCEVQRVVSQHRLPHDGGSDVPPMAGVPAVPPGTLGIPAYLTHMALQTDAFKELVNKLCWALGSTYRLPYGNTRTDVRQYALVIAKFLITDQGYPQHIRKD